MPFIIRTPSKAVISSFPAAGAGFGFAGVGAGDAAFAEARGETAASIRAHPMPIDSVT